MLTRYHLEPEGAEIQGHPGTEDTGPERYWRSADRWAVRPELRVSRHEPGLDSGQELCSRERFQRGKKRRKGGDSKPLIKLHVES